MDIRYWLERWAADNLKCQRADYQPGLVHHFPADPPGTVFVPLCGKTLDMIWLRDKGWKVIGVEASPIPCRAFFEENKIDFTEEKRGAFTVFSGGGVTIFCGDFFALKKEDLPGVTAAYDRAALVALPPETRREYAAHMLKLLDGRARMLLIAVDYPREKVEGPPFSVPPEEVRALYGAAFNISERSRREDSVLPKMRPEFEGAHPFETVYLLEPR
jgi:thiopurine S-methyltransferase